MALGAACQRLCRSDKDFTDGQISLLRQNLHDQILKILT
jgi:hypothetical protein